MFFVVVVFFFEGGGCLFLFSLWVFLFVCAFCSYVIIALMLNNLFMYSVCLPCTRFVLALFVRMLSCFSFVLVFIVVQTL